MSSAGPRVGWILGLWWVACAGPGLAETPARNQSDEQPAAKRAQSELLITSPEVLEQYRNLDRAFRRSHTKIEIKRSVIKSYGRSSPRTAQAWRRLLTACDSIIEHQDSYAELLKTHINERGTFLRQLEAEGILDQVTLMAWRAIQEQEQTVEALTAAVRWASSTDQVDTLSEKLRAAPWARGLSTSILDELESGFQLIDRSRESDRRRRMESLLNRLLQDAEAASGQLRRAAKASSRVTESYARRIASELDLLETARQDLEQNQRIGQSFKRWSQKVREAHQRWLSRRP